MKTILVYLPSEKTAELLTGAAFNIAAKTGAHVIGLHLVPELPLYGEFPGEVSDEVRENFAQAGRRAAEAIKQIFERVPLPQGVTKESRCFTETFIYGSERLLLEVRSTDLVVCGRFDRHVPDQWGDFGELVLIHSGRPILHVPVPAPETCGERVVIGWNETREAARALFDALPFLERAASVRALTLIDGEDERDVAQQSLARLAENMARRGVTIIPDIVLSTEGAGEALVDYVEEKGADLLVMGGYSHSRIRELIFGGVSRSVLRDVSVFTLMSH